MDKLNKLAMPDVKSGTPQEKMNAVKKALQSLEMMTGAYNQIVPVINAKIDWLSEAERTIKDDTQDKKIDQLIAVNKALLGRIAKLEGKGDYDDSKIVERIKSLEAKPVYKYDDRPIKKMIDEIAKQQGELARTQNSLSKEIRSIEIPKVPSVEPLRKRIKSLEDRPQYTYDDKALKERVKKLESAPKYVYDDKEIKNRIKALEDKPQYIYDDTDIKGRIKGLEIRPQYDDKPLIKRVAALELKPEALAVEKYDDSALLDKISGIEKSIESLNKRLDFVRRTYSEKWETLQFTKARDNNELNDKLSGFESEISELKKSFNEIFE